MIRTLKAASGDVVVVATVPTIEPYGDIREYAVKLFENHGRGIGDKGKDNGLLILLALKERRVWIEVGYGLEQWITDGFAGETSRDVHGAGVPAGPTTATACASAPSAIIGRIAQGRNVTLDGVRVPRERQSAGGTPIGPAAIVLIVHRDPRHQPHRRQGSGRGGVGRWGGGGWSGWSSGVGPFGGGGWRRWRRGRRWRIRRRLRRIRRRRQRRRRRRLELVSIGDGTADNLQFTIGM